MALTGPHWWMPNNPQHFWTTPSILRFTFKMSRVQWRKMQFWVKLWCVARSHSATLPFFDYKLDAPKCHTATQGLWGHVCRYIPFLLTLTYLLCKTSEGQQLLKRYERNKNSKVCPTPSLPSRDWKCSRGCFRTNFTGRVHGNEEICHPVRQDDSFMCF